MSILSFPLHQKGLISVGTVAPVFHQAVTLTNAAAFHRTMFLSSLGLDPLPNAGFLQAKCTVALTLDRCLLYIGLRAIFGIV